MAEGDASVPNNFKEQLFLKQIDCDSDTFKIALYSTGQFVVDGAAVSYSSSNELAVDNYDAGGAAISSPVVTQDDTNDLAKWDDDGSDVTWSSLGASTIRQAVLYDDTSTPKHVCVFWEIATDSNGGDYTLSFSASGIMTIS